MNLEGKDNNQLKEQIMDVLEKTENKSEAIYEALNILFESQYGNLIASIKEEAEKAESDKEYAKALKLRQLSKKEKDFYENFKDIKQAIAGNQIDLIPTSIVDLTLANVRSNNALLSHVLFAPSNVTKWYTANKTGSFAWAKLTNALDEKRDIEATFKTIITELGKLYILIIIPKSISELSLPFVDKFFTAVLEEQEEAGLVHGFLNGNGVEQPIGIYKQIDSVDETTKASKDKAVNADLTKFSPKGLASAKKYLTNDGIRSLDKIILICNPSDRADYVDPALYDAEGNFKSSYKNIDVIDTPENPKGKAALYLDKTYTLACSGFKVKNYDQTLALDDADLIIGTAHANGRAIDDNCAYVFDVTKLEEYIPKFSIVSSGTTDSESEIPEA